ncbi:related to Proteasome component ECM29 [Zygosaccharomyces bailii]|nr:related to Proteasome component ECM29 [Zygosaccharomyces bailii]
MESSISEEKEKELVQKVELRLALADTPEKFEHSLGIFLSPLLLKLSSPYGSVRQAVLGSLKDILARLNSLPKVRIPVDKLLHQAQNVPIDSDQGSANVRLYSLLLASKGVDRMSVNEKKQLIPVVMRGISKLPESAAARIFHILCKLILDWKAPQKGSKEEDEAFEFLNLENSNDLEFLSKKFTKFFFLIPARPAPDTGVIPRGYTCPGLSAADVSFFTYIAGVSFNKDQLLRFKSAIFRFFNSGFTVEARLLAEFLVVSSTDDSDISDTATFYLKRLTISVEDHDFIDYLVSLYIGDKKIGTPPVKYELQEKILSYLNKSVYATADAKRVSQICHMGLNSPHYKLRSLSLIFIRHVAKHNYRALIEQTHEREDVGFNINVASLIKNNLHSEGWPRLQLSSTTPNFASSLSQRRLQYETLGEILSKDFDLIKDFSYIEFLLDSLKGDLPDCWPSILEALNCLTSSLAKLPQCSKEKLKTVVRESLSDDFELESTESKERKDAIMACRFVLIKYTNAAFDFVDADARLFNVWGTSRINRFDIIEESYKGLNPYWYKINRASNTKEFKPTGELLASKITEIELPSFENFVNLLLKKTDPNSLAVTSAIRSTLGTAIRFSKQCLISQSAYGKATCVTQDEDWSLRIEKALDVDEKVPGLLLGLISRFKGDWFARFLKLLCAEVIYKDETGKQISISKYPDAIYGEFMLLLLGNCNDKTLAALGDLVPGLYNYLRTVETANDLDIATGANLLGIISASLPESIHVRSIITSSNEVVNASDKINPSTIANSYIFPRLYLRGNFQCIGVEKLESLLGVLLPIISVPRLKTLVAKLLCQLLKFGLILELHAQTRRAIILKIMNILGPKLQKDESLMELWGFLSLYSKESGFFDEIFSELYDTHATKQIELLFAGGEAFSILAGGWKSAYLAKQLDISRCVLGSLQHTFSDDYVSVVLDRILLACDSTKPSLRKSACIWLLSLVQYLKKSSRVISRCNEIHLRFMKFLADRDEFVQDSASRGLSLVYEIGNGDLQESMVKSLLKSFTDSANAMSMSSGSLSGETQLFEEGTLSTGEGSVSTYKDILNLASEVGDPSLVYKFMSLAKSSSLWSSRKGIAFGLGAIMSKSSLENLLLQDRSISEKLIPKLYRYKFDPYQSVSRSMNDIWNTLISNSNSIINEYFNEILQELLTGMGNKEWRVREASTLALLNLIQTQSDASLDDKLLDIWFMAFRSMDDIKESIREAGSKLTTVLAKMLARTVDVNKGVKPEKSRRILESIIPFLLGSKGLNSDAEEVRSFSLKTVVDLVKNSGSAMKPFAVDLVFEFILLFSSIEPQVVNFLSLNANTYKVDANTIDMHRKSAVTGSPLLQAIEKLIIDSDDSQMEAYVGSVTKAIKKSVGLPSKVAASTVLNVLVKRYSFSLKPFSGKLLKICMNHFEDRNESVRLAFAVSFGHVYHVASLEKCVKYAEQLSTRYFNSVDASSRKVVGYAIEAVSLHAAPQFEDTAGIYVPLLFVASNDANESIRAFFTKIWTESSSSDIGAVKLYLEEIVDLLEKNIGSNDFAMRRTCAKSVCLLCDKVDATVPAKVLAQLFSITIEALKGRTWEGKEVIVEAMVALAVKFRDYVSTHSELKDSIGEVLNMEISRQNKKYARQIVFCYCQYLDAFPSLPLIEKLIQVGQSYFDVPELDGSNKRSKPFPSEISVKSSKGNIEREDYSIKFLKACASICKPIDSIFPYHLAQFVMDKVIFLFQEDYVVYTWRTQVGACEIGLKFAENYESKYSTPEYETNLRIFWHELFVYNSTKETIENAKVQLIRLGGKWMNKDAQLKDEIQGDLIRLSEAEVSSKLYNELSNLGITH